MSSGRSYSLEIYAALGLEQLAPLAGALLAKDVAIFDDLTRRKHVALGFLVQSADSALDAMGHARES